MTKRTVFTIVTACLLAVVGPAVAQDLTVGSDAPELHIAKWVKGDAVDLSKAKADEVYVVEFWATWCGPCLSSIPHMSEMQDHFKSKGVTFIGVSDEKTSVVEKFLNGGWDRKMRYTVAMDDDGKTNKAWMKAAGKGGIPTAFVVKGGKIKWIGHPMSDLELTVADLAGDKEYAKELKELQAAKEAFGGALKDEDWKKALKAADSILAMRPKDYQILSQKYRILAAKIKDTAAATKVGHELVAKCDDAQVLNQVIWYMLTEDEFDDARDYKLAKKGAKKAMELTEHKNGSIIDTYARALADSGDLAGAIKWQKKAVEACGDNKQLEKQLAKTLEEYEKKAAEGI